MHGDEKRENWLLIKEADQDARPGSNGAFLEELASSVTTGRSMEEIARGCESHKRAQSGPEGGSDAETPHGPLPGSTACDAGR